MKSMSIKIKQKETKMMKTQMTGRELKAMVRNRFKSDDGSWNEFNWYAYKDLLKDELEDVKSNTIYTVHDDGFVCPRFTKKMK